MSDSEQLVIYQLHIFILGISPMIWRRIKIRSDSTIADLHYIIQIVMGWTDSHLHRFIIHGKHYGIAQIGGMWFSDDPKVVKLSDFGWRGRERFLYEYGIEPRYGHCWRIAYNRLKFLICRDLTHIRMQVSWIRQQCPLHATLHDAVAQPVLYRAYSC
jgi:hypothetical protein